MGGRSCLKLIPCGGGDPAGDGDLTAAENKASSDKRRWSFRKRSDRHRPLSNNVISEPVSLGYKKESPEDTTNNFHPQKVLSVPEKAPIEEFQLSAAVANSEVVNPAVTEGNTTGTDNYVEDSVATVMQAAIRAYIARRELLKHKNVIKLQAAVRGHLVRRQAIGTLRCIQAIIKMQAIVRDRYTHHRVEDSAEKDNGELQMDAERSMLSVNKDPCTKANKAYCSTRKLLSNRFAQQFLESAPKTKHIYIKCDPLRSDSAWKWLERWMVATALDKAQQQDQHFNQDYEHEESTKHAAHETANEIPVVAFPVMSDLPTPSEAALPSDEGKYETEHSAVVELQPTVSGTDYCFRSLANNDLDFSHLWNEPVSKAPKNNINIEIVHEQTSEPLSNEIMLQSSKISEPGLDVISDKPEFDSDMLKYTNKAASGESLENEGKKVVLGSRKSINPAFAAVQLKFEELSSATSVGRPSNVHHDALTESKSDNHSPENFSSNIKDLSSTNIKDLGSTENSVAHASRFHNAASECGTEISISSTLDSPDRSDAEGGEIVLEIGSLEKGDYPVNGGADNAINLATKSTESKNFSLDPEVIPTQGQKEKRNVANLNAAKDVRQMNQQKVEVTTSDMQTQTKNAIDPQVYRSSPEGTPRSRTTATESHGTPSSQVSLNTKKGKKGTMSTRKQKPQLSGKRSPSNPNHDSGGKSSTDHLPKESKTAKRRNSFGTMKPENVDHEPRISNSSSLPSYMQATESAKAKAHASISAKSSPDVQEDNYPKKRHSLPVGNGKQGSSPRMQRSASQAQHNSKVNGTNSPHDSNERRWQR